MSKTNQVCITCTQRDTCQYYDTNRTICVPVKVSDYGQFAGSLQPTIDWRQVRIQAAIAAMQAELSNPSNVFMACEDKKAIIVKRSVGYADALVAELKRSDDVYAECRRMGAINTASVCENMTKIQKELQKKDDNADV